MGSRSCACLCVLYVGIGGVAMTKSGGMTFMIKEPKVVDCPGGEGKCGEVAIVVPWTDLTGSLVNVAEVVSGVEEGSGEGGECVYTTHGSECNVELCPQYGKVECFDISATMTEEEVRRYVQHTCNDGKDGCEMHIGRESMLFFTADECNRICKLFS